jgi:hypothetical protein
MVSSISAKKAPKTGQPRHFSTLRISLCCVNPSIDLILSSSVFNIFLLVFSDFKLLAILLEDSYSSLLTSISFCPPQWRPKTDLRRCQAT